jgi:hypothetical protein
MTNGASGFVIPSSFDIRASSLEGVCRTALPELAFLLPKYVNSPALALVSIPAR